VQLANRRLAILDRSARGAQPMADGGWRYRITLSGEIDNDLEPRAEPQHLIWSFAADNRFP